MPSPAADKDHFEDQGFLIIEDVLCPDELQACQDEIKRLHHLAAELQAKGDPAGKAFQQEPYTSEREIDALPVLRKIENTGSFSPLFRDLAAHPRLVPAIQTLLGPDLLLFRSTLMLKPALHGSAHGLHQDSAYWPMEPPSLVTCSIALNEATAENGCLKVVPGSHHLGLRQWGAIARRQDAALTDTADDDLADPIDVPLKAGSALLFHSLTVHGSGPNRSKQPRNTALYAYFPPQVRYLPGPNGPAEKRFAVVAGLDGRTEMTLTAEQS